jgi:D-amino-acid dehydrogenase
MRPEQRCHNFSTWSPVPLALCKNTPSFYSAGYDKEFAMKVCVLGAGIVGLAAAYTLRQQGCDVTVVDKATPGAGTSGGNGAQLSYSYVQPLADASLWAQLPKLLWSADSPLKLRPQWDTQQWRWGIEFLRACNRTTSARSTAHLLALATRSRADFDAMMAAHQLDCDYASTGKLVLYPDLPTFDAAQRQMALQSTLGSQQQAISAQQCQAIEPALASYVHRVAGAIYTPSECAVDCLKLCKELTRVLRAQGVHFVLGTDIHQLHQRGSCVVAARTDAGDIEADHYVMALGCASVALARSVGVRLPVYPIKGYSITLDVADAAQHAPTVSITDIARKVVYARLGQRLRVAGMAELVGHNLTVSPVAINSLQRSAADLFPPLADCAVTQPWAGLRPATPTGLPIVGVQPGGPCNLHMNAGHGALGLTLAFGTAQQLAQQLISVPSKASCSATSRAHSALA